MAGDWIKFETATLDKPEVALFAELLGVPVDQGVGLLIRFWVWLDRNSRHGDVTHVSRLSVDTVMHCPGFSAALESVGWSRFDDSARTMHMPNFSRHNGKSAKTRALSKDRKAEQRSRESHADNVTREEKRRDTSTNVDVVRTRKTVLQEPSAKHQELADQLGLSCQAEFQKYRDHFAANGKSHKDEDAGFRVWLRNADRFKPRVVAGREPTLAEKRAANMAAITGQVKREREVFAERVGVAPFPALPSDLGEQGDDDVGGCTPERAYRDVG